jgi:replicative DNA helicase
MDVSAAKELFYRPSDERTTLSLCLRKIDHFYDLTTKMTSSDFLGQEHQLIYALLSNFVEKGVTKIDLPMFISQAQSDGVIDLLGGMSYIQSIYNIEASSENFELYVKNLLEASTKYKAYVALTQHLDSFTANAQAGESSLSLINKVEASMLDMTTRNTLNEDPVRLGDTLDEYIEERKDKLIKMTGLSTGFPILDRQIDGMIPGTLMIVGARKKMGKSSFLTNIAIHNAFRAKVPVLYIDTELTYMEFKTRALSIISGVPERTIKHGGYSDMDYRSIKNAQKVIDNGRLFHKYMPGYTVDKVVALCKKYKLRENIGMIVFDYLKEPDLSSTDGNRKEYQLLGDITTKLKDLAGILDVPVLSAVQLNRNHDIADSDRIARFGDVIALWQFRTEEEKKICGIEGGQYKLVIKDTRRGGSTPKEGIGYTFFRSRILIREVPPADQIFISGGDKATESDELEVMYTDAANPYVQAGAGDEIT